jgi:chromosome segregation ATPase
MWFSKKKADLDNLLKQAQQQLAALAKENELLSFKIEDLEESDLKNHLMLSEFQERAAKADLQIQDLTAQWQVLENTITNQQETLQLLTDEIHDLEIQTESKAQPTESLQDVLDLAEAKGELVVFKDSKGNFWQLLKRPELEFEEEQSEEDSELSSLDD